MKAICRARAAAFSSQKLSRAEATHTHHAHQDTTNTSRGTPLKNTHHEAKKGAPHTTKKSTPNNNTRGNAMTQ